MYIHLLSYKFKNIVYFKQKKKFYNKNKYEKIIEKEKKTKCIKYHTHYIVFFVI